MKKVPMRMCVACREMKPKKELIRVVRTPEGEIVADATGRKNGRGAYLCPVEGCLNKAIKTRALERALEQPLSEAAADYLRQVILGGGNEAV
ncbi:MAG: YlxR family protein [Clostridia bacterium]|nr:YlxR family protein [Clostridia bacterium]MBQ6357421.1 YlxR family protein [Clostridia bacterium]MBQ9323803.1 YlxR family protein [Clostridia bacterium]MBR0422081.1 YlxR family protein [Clostridia bacterium]